MGTLHGITARAPLLPNRSSRRDILIALIAVGAFLFFLEGQQRAGRLDPCADASRGHRLECYNQLVNAAIEADGIGGALHYAMNVVLETDGQGMNHMAMHLIGRAAYDETHDRRKALAYLPSLAHTGNFYLRYEGYQHGVLQAFFSDRSRSEPIAERIRESCNEYFDPSWANPAPYEYSHTYAWTAARQCSHGVGHALMHANGNDVKKSLPYCEVLSYPWMQDRCAFGVFMEHSYLYWPDYDPGHPRPLANGDSMAPLCEALPEKFTPSARPSSADRTFTSTRGTSTVRLRPAMGSGNPTARTVLRRSAASKSPPPFAATSRA